MRANRKEVNKTIPLTPPIKEKDANSVCVYSSDALKEALISKVRVFSVSAFTWH